MQNQKKQKSTKRVKGNRKLPAQGVVQDSPYPTRKFCRLNYSDVILMTESAVGVGAVQSFRASDVYDPDLTGVGHQPLYFDQLCTGSGPYLLHFTKASKFHLRLMNNSAATPVLVVAYFSITGGAPSGRTQASEKPFAWKHILPPLGTGGAVAEKTMSIDNPKFVGISPQGYEATYSGSSGGPANGPVLTIAVYGFGAVASVYLHVNAVYDTTFYQLGPIATS